jgi:hypothetical protein
VPSSGPHNASGLRRRGDREQIDRAIGAGDDEATLGEDEVGLRRF